MKKIVSILMALIMVVGLMGAPANAENAKKISIVTTIFPIYDWVRNIVGENSERYEITMLLDNGIDLHSYQPSVDHIVKISNADLFIYTGGVSDTWAKDAIKNATNKNIQYISLVETLGDMVKNEAIVEGMEHHHHHDDEDHEDHEHEDHERHDQEHEDHEHHDQEHEDHEHHDHEHEDHEHHDQEREDHEHHDHEHEDHEHHDHEHELDEHVWLSLENADLFCNAIAKALCNIDPENAEAITNNYAEYSKKLEDLDERYEKAIEESPNKTLLFADRFPFRYLVDDYDLSYYAAFSGCSAETEASFETVSFLAKKLDELKLKNVITIDGRTHKIAETVIGTSETKDQEILVLDSLQSIKNEDVQNGADYLSIMEKNLEVLKKALQ